MAKITEIESNDPPEKNQNNADTKRSGSFLNFAKRIPAIKLWYRDSTNRQEQNNENQNIKLDSKLLSSSDCDEAERQGAVKKTINDFDKKQTKRKNSFVKRLKNYVCDLDTKPNFYVDLEDNVTEECNYGYVVEEPVTPICGSSTVTSLCDSVEEIFDENDSVNSSVYIASESEVLLIFPNKKETDVDQSPTCSENGEKYVVDLNTDEDISNALKSNIDENRTRECSTHENIIITDIGKDFRISISVEDISQIKSNFGIENSNNESLNHLNAATEVTNNDQIKICEKNLCGESISLDNNASEFEINYSNQKHGHGNVKSYKNVGINDNLCKQNITGDAKEELIINHKHAYSLDDPCLQTSINNNRKWIKVNNEATKKNVNFNNRNCFLYEKENGLIEDMKRNANLKKCFSLNVKSDNSKVKCKKIPSFYNSVRSARFHRNAEEDIFKNETREGDRVVGINNQPADHLAQARRSLQAAPDLVLLRLVRQLAAPGCHGGATGVTVPGAMGANVSRHTGKGLSGRRTQSSGNICNGNKAPQVSKLLGSCASGSNQSDNNKQRRRFCGSLPNHLDGTEENTECDSVCYVKENNNHAPPTPPVATVSATVVVGGKKYPAPPPPSQRYVSAPTPPHVPITGNGNVKYHQPLTLKVAAGSDTALCDQGYGSERSPEDENPPPGHSGSEPGTDEGDIYAKYPFITPEATFTVFLTRGGRGLGLSVGGGADVTGPWPGLVRVKRLFPNQPASLCGFLAPGDLLLEANGVKLTGLTNYEALEVLRTLPANVVLTVCRPPQEVLSAVSPLSDVPPPPPRRDPPCSLNLLPPLAPTDEPYCGEFDVTLAKVQGSLGFTLRKEDESALGHYIRALVREPALSDGRVKPGDKIVAVNDVELSSFSHEQAVQFLRQCGNEVKLRLYRDSSQTPVAALSPTDPDPPQRLKPLRQEAMDMLSDLAVRKLSPGASGDSSWSRSGGNRSLSPPGESPRRLRKNQQRSTPDSECENSIYTDEKGLVKIYTTSSQVTSESDSLSRKASLGSDHASGNLSSIESENDKPIRPNFLNLCSPVLTPTRKPKFQFSLAHNAYELNNLDAEVLDAPNIQYTLKTGQDVVDSSSPGHGCNIPEEPASMPPISTTAFSYKNPVYQSAHPQCGSEHVNEPNSDGSKSDNGETKVDGSKGLLKWKGVVFSPEGSSDDTVVLDAGQSSNNENIDSDLDTITVELNRGWNCRLGFSLQQHSTGGTYISAVHADSVAAKDGRLKMGDILLKVNDEDISSLPTNDVIDLLRIVRGPVSIVVGRNNNVAL